VPSQFPGRCWRSASVGIGNGDDSENNGYKDHPISSFMISFVPA
jgi:hypothetical protein